MGKLMQFFFALVCLGEIAGKDICKTNKRGVYWVVNLIELAAGSVIFCGLLAYSIFNEWVKIPVYMGDGADYN